MLKNSLWAGSVVVLGVALAARGDLVNGDFANGLSGWDYTENFVDVQSETARLLEGDEFDFTELSQDYTIDPGAEVLLSFTFALFSVPTGQEIFPFDALAVYLLDEFGGPLISNPDPFIDDFFYVSFEDDPFYYDSADGVLLSDVQILTDENGFGVGGVVTVDITPFASQLATLDFQLLTGNDGFDSHAFIDNVGLAVTPVPTPASALLALVGCVFAAGSRRIRA